MVRRIAFSLLGLLVLCAPCAAKSPSNFDRRAAEGVLQRLLPRQAQQFELGELPRADAGDRYRISTAHNHIRVEGSSTSALLFGINWYLKYVAQAQISPNGDRLPAGNLPLPDRVIEGGTPYELRYALNENVDGYTTAYWDWSRWEREIDVLALSGINAILIERGMDSVLYRTFRDFGYTDEELRNWITLPAHQNWQLMGNLCCYNGPISTELLQRRAASAKQIIARLRELGITPVLPGFFGIVPKSFKSKYPQSHVVPQGEWAGFERPDWLDPRDPLYARIAAAFYAHQRELYGQSNVYDMEVFQEGGDDGGVPVATAAKAVQTALETANPGSLWMMMAWQGNPRQDLLSGVDRNHLLIVDIDHDREPRDHRQADFQGTPFLFGGIWEFGGRTTFGANINNITERLQRLAGTNSNMVGTGLFTEGMDTNPFAYDLFTEMAWRHEPIDVESWAADYVRRRYGAADPHALAAWKILIRTAYNIRIDEVKFNSERDAAQESLFDAQPSLTANRASNWSPEAMRYDAQLFKKALPELLAAAPTLKNMTYDLVDVGRQTLANESRLLLPQIEAAFESKSSEQFDQLTQRWLHLMDLQEQLLRAHPAFMVGTWLGYVQPWASNPDELRRLQLDARSLLTTWGDRHASEAASLHDYGNKDWSGLTGDYYKARWQAYFRGLKEELRTGKPAPAIDWFTFGEKWNRDTGTYPTVPTGDARQIAQQIVRETLARRDGEIHDPDTLAWWHTTEALSGDDMEGRDTGSPAYQRAAEYVAKRFEAAGLQPAGDTGSYFQSVPMHEIAALSQSTDFTLVRTDGSRSHLKFLEEIAYEPEEGTPAAEFEGALTFRGYCGGGDMNDVAGKIVVCFGNKRASLPGEEARIGNAVAGHALAIVTVDDPYFNLEPPRWPVAYARKVTLRSGSEGAAAQPICMMRLSAAAFASFVTGTGHDATALLAAGGAQRPLPDFDIPGKLQVHLGETRRNISSPNVLAVLPGTDPGYRNEYVVVSAHLDGYGFGTPVNGDSLYNGTLDDAAYVALLIQMADDIHSHKLPPPGRGILFAAFTGEEKGLLGSKWFVQHPTVPLSRLAANVNLDQLRPLFPLDILTVEALEDTTLGSLAQTVASSLHIQLRPDSEPERHLLRRADQYPFLLHGVPAISFVFGYDPGTLSEQRYREWYKVRYHRPQDEVTQPIDFAAAAKFNEFFYKLVAAIADSDRRPQILRSSQFADR